MAVVMGIAPIVAAAILMGVLPNLFLKPMAPSVDRLLTLIHRESSVRASISHEPSAISH